MALKIGFGQYYAANSVLHRLDPRTKLLSTLALFVAAFCIATPAQLLFACIALAGLLALSHVPAKQILVSLKPAALLVVVLSLVNLFWTQTGPVLGEVGILRITRDGATSATLSGARLLIAIAVGSLLLLTTTPTRLTDGLDSLFSPLARLGIPSHEIAMVVALTLRFVPILADETSAIMDAQTARGGGISEGGMRQRIQAIGPILIALFGSSMRHAQSLGRALDARSYEGGAKRTHLYPLKMRSADWCAIALVMAFVAALIALG